MKDSILGSDTSDREIVVSRLIHAPQALVFEAWTNPIHVVNWWGPDGFTNTIHEMDVRPGGVWRLTMHGPDGVDYPNRIQFIEVIQPERLVYIHGNGDLNDPGSFHVTVTFDKKDENTFLTMRAVFATAAARDKVVEEFGALEGGKQTLAHLDEYVKTMKGESC